MKILIIRHGEPDYERDCLTDHGREQAELLGKRLEGVRIDAAFASPMGRAAETAEIALAGRGIDIVTLDWLHEFDVKVPDGDLPERVYVWDVRPKNWTNEQRCYDRERFLEVPGMDVPELRQRWEAVDRGMTELLARHGLEREGGAYRKTGDTEKTLALFCHFGATCASMASLLRLSPVVTLQSFSAEPTAVTTLCTDDRFGEVVNFRIHGFGDISHLGETVSGGINYK